MTHIPPLHPLTTKLTGDARRRTPMNLGPLALETLTNIQRAYARMVGRPVSRSLVIRRALQALDRRLQGMSGDQRLEDAEVAALMRCR